MAPVPVYGNGNSTDYTITSNSGSWSITPLGVTITGGSYSHLYDGSAHSPSAWHVQARGVPDRSLTGSDPVMEGPVSGEASQAVVRRRYTSSSVTAHSWVRA